MSCPFFPRFPGRWLWRLVALAAVLASVAAASAAPQNVLPFRANTWNDLAHSKPLAAVFSTTDCVHCPKVIDELAMAIRKSGSPVRLAVVVMDGAGQDAALRTDRHYHKANILYAFDGDAMALRFKVNPDRRGLTPYVARIPATGVTRFHTGLPPSAAVRDFPRP